MSRHPPLRLLLVTLSLPLAVLAGGQIFAYWNGSGNGTGAGAAGSTVAVILTRGTPAATLYPGGQSGVVLSASNPNSSPVHIGSLALDTTQGSGGFSVDGGHSACNLSALTYTTQSNGGNGWTVPAKVGAVNGTLALTLSNSLAMGLGAASACQGASIDVYLIVAP